MIPRPVSHGRWPPATSGPSVRGNPFGQACDMRLTARAVCGAVSLVAVTHVLFRLFAGRAKMRELFISTGSTTSRRDEGLVLRVAIRIIW
jgi:hypothetical protein